MAVQVHGFDWKAYSQHVMPTLAQWLIDRDQSAVQQLFEQTRCAREEQFLPPSMQRLRIWPRAQAFVEALPRGPYSRREYQKLCSAEHFTALSDRYLYKYAPQLYQNSPALRSVWGALIETYCLPWNTGEQQAEEQEPAQAARDEPAHNEQIIRSELVSLLEEAGLSELAKEIGEQKAAIERFDWEPGDAEDMTGAEAADDLVLLAENGEIEDAEEEISVVATGIAIGQPPNTLRLRGWLAAISLRAMILFEYLACGRRGMPFGYEAGEPFGAYIGYLTPDEIWQLANCLQDVIPPGQADAEEDYLNFRYQQPGIPESFRLVDEVLPSHAADFLKAVRIAAQQGLGLICSVE